MTYSTGQMLVRRGGNVRFKVLEFRGKQTEVWDLGRRAKRVLSTESLNREFMPVPR